MSNIPAGYQLHVTTWENDADAYQTKILNGLGINDVTFLVALAKQFKSRNSSNGLGNGATTRDELIAAITSALTVCKPNQKLQDQIDAFYTIKDEEDEDDTNGFYVYEWLTETLLGYPVEEFYRYDYERFCRVYSSHEVFLIPLECINVSEQFQ